MKTIGIVALAAIAALVLGFGARLGTQTAHAETEGSVAIGCEFLADAIDGAVDNVINGTDSCVDGIDSGDVANLANALGDEDDELEASDFEDIDLDANQIQDGVLFPLNSLLLFNFVDNDGVVTFDSETGLDIAVHVDTNGAPSADGDANPETCDAADDLDCDVATLGDGDGVVVAFAFDDGSASSDPGDEIEVDMLQADDTGQVSTQTVNIVGDPDGITLDVLKNPVQVSGDSSDVNDCEDESDVSDSGQLADLNRTFLKATVTDDDDRELTRIPVDYEVDDDNIAVPVSDASDPSPGDEPSGATPFSVDAGAAGIGDFIIVCGGEEAGTATITATETVNDNDADVEVDVVGEPANVALTASPAAIDCNGVSTSTVSATVTDADGNNVADGNTVNFSVVALGTANPINDDTAAGVASSTITPLSGAVAGVTVIVTAGEAQASIRVDCNTPAAATATPGGRPTTPGGGIGGPDTGNGGYLGQDSAGFPTWTLIALALGSLALVTGGMVTRRVGK